MSKFFKLSYFKVTTAAPWTYEYGVHTYS